MQGVFLEPWCRITSLEHNLFIPLVFDFSPRLFKCSTCLGTTYSQDWIRTCLMTEYKTTATPNHPIRAMLQTVSLLQHDQQLLEGMVAKTQAVTSCLQPAHALTSPTNMQW